MIGKAMTEKSKDQQRGSPAGSGRLEEASAALPLTLGGHFRIGIPEIDNDHQDLFNMLKLAQEAGQRGDAKGVFANLALFRQFLAHHFFEEERAMTLNDYPRLDQHRRSHEALLAGLADRLAQVRKVPQTDLGPFVLEITENYLSHLVSADLAFKSYLEVLTAEGTLVE